MIDLGVPNPAARQTYPPRPSATGKDRISALDGLRAVALLIIMGYHFGVGWLGGGFFSLDIFYVLSGYLITGLLVSEYRKRGRITLSAFWLRRARRLLPALIIVLVAVTLMVRFGEPAGLYPDFRMSALSALFYFSNWWQIATSSNYFLATGAVSPLTHTWSLAVEEQFYLVWPLVVLAVMHLSRNFARGIRALLVVSAVGAVASAVEMALLFNPAANTTRLYFGTDTHAQSILVGSAMACTMTIIQMRRGNEGMAPIAGSTIARRGVVVLGLVGFAGTLILTSTLGGTSSFDYRGGFFLSALSAAAIIIGAVCVPRGPIAGVLSLPALVWLGTISYGAYLWHYPVFVYLDTARTGLVGLPLLTIRFATTFGLAAASYYLVERPVMYGTFWRSLKAVGPATALLVATVAVVVAGTAAPANTVGGSSFPVADSLLWLLAALLVAMATYLIIENPIRHTRFLRARRSASVVMSGCLIISTLAVGTVVVQQQGPTTLGAALAVTSGSTCRTPSQSQIAALRSTDESMSQPARYRATPQLRMAVVGDSTACTMLPGLYAVAPSHGLQIENGAVIGCGIVSGQIAPYYYGSVNLVAYTENCQGYANSAEAAAFKRGMPNIILWGSTDEKDSIVVRDSGGSKVLVAGTPEWKAKMLKRIDTRVQQFISTGAKVVLLLQPPIPDPGNPTRPTQTDLTFERMNLLLREAAARFPGSVGLINLATRVCPSGPPCPYVVDGMGSLADGTGIRPDGLHYSPTGSLWLARWLVPQILNVVKSLG